jgi:hypothetical protein
MAVTCACFTGCEANFNAEFNGTNINGTVEADPGPSPVPLPPPVPPGTPDLDAFKETYYPFARAACFQCHESIIDPGIASTDLSTAFAAALPYASLIDPGQSLLITRAEDGHCGTMACTSNPDGMNALIAWSEAASLTAFQNTFYRYATTNGCVNCHSSVQLPLLASPQPGQAFVFTKNYVDLKDPPQSAVVYFAGNGHCGEGCIDSSSALIAVTAWADQLAAGD